MGHSGALGLGKKQVILNSHSFSGWGSFKFHLLSYRHNTRSGVYKQSPTEVSDARVTGSPDGTSEPSYQFQLTDVRQERFSPWYQMTGHKHRTATIIWRSFLNPTCATRSKTTWDCLCSHLPKSPICSDLKLPSHLQIANIRITGSNLKTQNKTCLLEAELNRKCTSFLLTRDVFMKPSIVGWRWGLFPFV